MVYILIFLLLIILTVLSEVKTSNTLELIFVCVIGTTLLLLAGLRGNIEADYLNYKDIFQNSEYGYSVGLNIEPGYFYLNKLFQLLHLGFPALVFFVAMLSIIPKIYFFKKYAPNFGFSLLAYFAAIYFLFDFIQVRQAITMSVFMLCLPFIYEKKFWPYCLALLAAATIHISAILLIPGYFVFNRKYDVRWMYAIMVVCGIVSVLQYRVPIVEMLLKSFPVPGFTADKIAYYSASTEFAPLSLKQLVLGFCFIFIRDKVNEDTDEKRKMFNVLVNLFVIGIFIATLLNGLAELSFRIKWYFFWTEVVLVAYLVKYVCYGRFTLVLIAYGLLILVYGYMLFSLLTELASRGDYIFPYRLFFE